jgi:hypothetical protein
MPIEILQFSSSSPQYRAPPLRIDWKCAHVSLCFVGQHCHPAFPIDELRHPPSAGHPAPSPTSSPRRRAAPLRRLRVVPAPSAGNISPTSLRRRPLCALHYLHRRRAMSSLCWRVVPIPYLTSLVRGCRATPPCLPRH